MLSFVLEMDDCCRLPTMARGRAVRQSTLPKWKAEFSSRWSALLLRSPWRGRIGATTLSLTAIASSGIKTNREAILYSPNGKNFSKRYPYLAEALDGRYGYRW